MSFQEFFFPSRANLSILPHYKKDRYAELDKALVYSFTLTLKSLLSFAVTNASIASPEMSNPSPKFTIVAGVQILIFNNSPVHVP